MRPATADEPVDLGEGWAVVDALLSDAECDALAATVEARRWPDIPDALVDWIMDPRWAPLVVPTLGPEVRFLREQVVTKTPRADVQVPWHQDSGYARVPTEFVTCFLALDDITIANGCLWVLPGSHLGGLVDHRPSGYWREVAAAVDDPGVPIELARGSALVFSSFTLHRSGGNGTDGRRPAWMAQFCRADALDTAGAPLSGCPVVADAGGWLDRPRF